MSRGWHLASSLSLRIVSQWCCNVPCLSLSHIVIVSTLHSPTIFRCLQIIMITSLLPQWHRDVRGRVRGAGDTYWWSGHLTWLHSIVTPPHTEAIVSTHYYYNNPIFSPHHTPHSLSWWHDMRGAEVLHQGVSLWSPQWSLVSALGHTSVNTGDEGWRFIFYRKISQFMLLGFLWVVQSIKLPVSFIIIHGNIFEGKKWSRNNTIILEIGNSTQPFQSIELLFF